MRRNTSRYIAPAQKLDAGKSQHKNLTVVVPVAGIAHRMKSYGPKCLFHTSANSTILDRAIKNIQKVYTHAEIIVVVGFDADKIIERVPRSIRIIENQIYDTTNTIESIRLALNNAVDDDILIMHGDLIFNIYAIRDITNGGSCAIIDTQERFDKNEIGVTVVEGKITNFSYGLPAKWAQIIYLTGTELELFRRFCSDREKNKMYIFEILNMVLESGGIIHAEEPKGMQIIEIDSLKDLPKWGK